MGGMHPVISSLIFIKLNSDKGLNLYLVVFKFRRTELFLVLFLFARSVENGSFFYKDSVISFNAIVYLLSFLVAVYRLAPIDRAFVFISFYNLLHAIFTIYSMRVLYFRIQIFRDRR